MTFQKGYTPWNKDKHIYLGGGFKKGNKICLGRIPWNKDTKGLMPEPWNKNTKGICKPNSGSFKKGHKVNVGKIKQPLSEEHKRKLATRNRGKHSSPEIEFKKGQRTKNWNGFKKGCIPWNKDKEGYINEGSFKKGITSWNKNKRYKTSGTSWNKNKRGKELPYYKGLNPLYLMIRRSPEAIQWRKEVFKRDRYICQNCGYGKGHILRAHHKKEFIIILEEFLQKYNQFSLIEDKETLLRLSITYEPFWDLDNGITYCEKCHKEEHKRRKKLYAKWK